MSAPRAFSVRLWLETLGWISLASLFVLVQVLQLPDEVRNPLTLFFLFLAAYLFLTFYYLFPRWNYARHLVYATLALDVLIVGVLDFVLANYLPDFEVAFVPLIIASALVANRRGTIAMALFAALVDFAAELRLVLDMRRPVTTAVLMDQALVTGSFVITGLVTVLLVEAVRRRALEASSAIMQAAESERQRREDAERSARRWEILNVVGLKVQQESEPQRIFDVTSAQMKLLHLDFLIALWEEPEKTLRLRYLSIAASIQKIAEDLVGVSAQEVRFDLQRSPLFLQALSEHRAIYKDKEHQVETEIVPHISQSVLNQIVELTGSNRRIAAPLVIGNQSIGILVVWGRDLVAADLPAMTGLAQHIAIALDKARLMEQVQKRARQLALVSEISARAGVISDPQEFMNQVVRLVGEGFGYQIVGVMLTDPTRKDLYVAAAWGQLADRNGPAYRQSVEIGIVGWVARNGQTYLARDVRTDKNYIYPLDDADPVRSELCVPLRHQDQVIGVLDLDSQHVDAFDASDVAAMELLADQIAVTLNRSQALTAHQKRLTQLALVNEIAERIASALNADELLGQVTQLVVTRFGFENASILINDTPAREIVLHARAGKAINPKQIGYRQSWEIGLLGLAARTGKTVVVNDVRVDPNYYTTEAEKDACRSELCVPLRRGVQILGVLDVQSTQLNAFEPSDVIALETLSSQIAIALEKGELLAVERKRAAQLALVSTIAQRAAAILDADQLLDEVVHLIRDRFGFFDVSIFMLDEAGRELIMRANAGFLQSPAYRQSIDMGLIGAAARAGTIVVVNDVRLDPRYYLDTLDAAIARSELCVPLKIGERTAGVLDVQSAELNAFDASDAASMEALANQIMISLENARLYARTKDDAEVKAALLRELSHRVKNNLTAIVGLLYIGLDDKRMSREKVLDETLTRLQSMAVAHSLLVHSPWARIDLRDLSRSVLKESVKAMTMPGQNVPFNIEGESIEISARQATSLALVLNEMVTNAVKHGGDQLVHISLAITRADGMARLELFSRGAKLVSDFQPERRGEGLGLKLIRTLVEKDLRGSFSLSARGDGVVARIEFPPEGTER